MQQPADMPPFSPAGWRGPAGAPSPISSRPPAPATAPGQQQQHHQQQMDEQHGAAVSGSGSGSVDGGEEGERGGSSSAAGGNRWPRQETLALLKIRSEMDAAFREAALKGPLWEQVSRRLAEMGHTRSAKKCREKFENVDKYYRRTKDGRTGRGDGKTYRFFTELEALHGAAAHHPPPAPVPAPAPAATIVAYSAVPSAPSRVPSPPPLLLTHQPAQPVPATEAAACLTTTAATLGDASFSESDGEDTDETADGGKRKRRGGSWGHGGKAMRFFEGLMRQVMERQEAMQSRLLEAIERRDQDRMIREEACRRQEVARLAREQDALAQERAVAASRDAAVVSFIQRITGQIVPVQAPSSFPAHAAGVTSPSVKPPPLQPTPVASAAPAQAPPTPRPPVQAQPNVTPMRTQPQTPQPQPQPQVHVKPTTAEPQAPTPQHQQSKEIVVHAPEPPVDMAGGASPSRWPKAEVHALIQLRTEMETRYQDTAPKGPLWEDISVGMRRLGYNRSSKRCKEKWENINKYFKKVKESSRKRPEDSKTCPYFHQLDALYRTKALASSSSSGVHAPALAPAPSPARAEAPAVTVLSPVPLSSQTPPPAAQHVEHGVKNLITNGNGNGNGAAMQVKASNGAPPATAIFPSPVHAAGNGGNNGTASNKLDLKQEGVAKETATVVQPAVAMNHSYGHNERRDVYDLDSDSMDEDEEDDFDDDDDEDEEAVPGGRNINMPPVHQYDAHFLQRQHQQQQHQNHNHGHNVVRPNAANGSGNPPAGNATPTSAAATSGTPFLAMVQ